MLGRMERTADCTSCCGYSSCGGCYARLELSRNEVDLLRQLAQIPFLPVGRKINLDAPVYLELGDAYAPDYGAAIISLYQKHLITLDYDRPLLNFDYKEYEECEQKGSFALTAAGQHLVESLEIQGIEE